MRRGAQARTTKAKGRIDRFHQLEESKLVVNNTALEMKSVSSRLGKKIIELEHVSKAFDGVPVISDFSYTVLRNDRIGIIGENGSGKSTLLKLISGELQPDSGSVEIGETVKIGYFSQENEHMDKSRRVIEYICDIAQCQNGGRLYQRLTNAGTLFVPAAYALDSGEQAFRRRTAKALSAGNSHERAECAASGRADE